MRCEAELLMRSRHHPVYASSGGFLCMFRVIGIRLHRVIGVIRSCVRVNLDHVSVSVVVGDETMISL